MEHILKVLSYHGQIDAQISTNSGQIRPKDPQEHKEKLQVPCYSKFSRKEMITSSTWHEMRQFQQPHHYTVCQWGFYPKIIVKTCKKWVMTMSSSMAMYSVMRDIPDARKVPIERGWFALHLYATCKFSNHLTLEQWAFEYGLPLFWYALYFSHFHSLFTILVLFNLRMGGYNCTILVSLVEVDGWLNIHASYFDFYFTFLFSIICYILQLFLSLKFFIHDPGAL